MEATNDIAGKVYFYKPSLMSRIKAMILDTVIVIGLMMLISALLNALNIESGLIRGLGLALVILYEPILVSKGGTLGHRLMGLRVKAFDQLSENKIEVNIHFLRAIIRVLIKIGLGWISLLTIHSDDYGQAIHDKAGNSVMTFE